MFLRLLAMLALAYKVQLIKGIVCALALYILSFLIYSAASATASQENQSFEEELTVLSFKNGDVKSKFNFKIIEDLNSGKKIKFNYNIQLSVHFPTLHSRLCSNSFLIFGLVALSIWAGPVVDALLVTMHLSLPAI